MFLGCATAHVEEVGWFTTVVLDDVHGCHGETGAVDKACDVAIETNVVEVVFRCSHFTRIFLLFVSHGDDVRMAIERVVIEAELGVEREHAAIGRGDEWIDLEHRAIALNEKLVEIAEKFRKLLGIVAFETKSGRDFPHFVGLEAEQRMNELTDDFLGSIVRDVLDVHATFRGSNNHRTACGTVHQNREVIFVRNVHGLGYHHLTHQATSLARLHGNESFVQHFAGEIGSLLRGLDQMHTTLEAILEVTFATTTGMHLGLDDKLSTSKLAGRSRRFFGCGGNFSFRTRDLEAVKQLFGLIFVDIHKIFGALAREKLGRQAESVKICQRFLRKITKMNKIGGFRSISRMTGCCEQKRKQWLPFWHVSCSLLFIHDYATTHQIYLHPRPRNRI